MFYSQFILAKKGPLGTIWIAAHLERKLRKNQVADTDIGVSVDSILFPEVPIALRLSSHLLLGVVRIYSRKVNYLFDDCSEALLKIKQAFRSTAVDLPPEESTAPYHSITLPETFDLDDFELPDNDILQGNYVDHHVSTREQITLQDSMEGVAYSTSQFGLDERFGDGDTSQVGLDLEEDLFLNKVASPVLAEVSEVEPQSSEKSMACLQPDINHDGMIGSSETMPVNCTREKVEHLATISKFIDYAQAPSTPGLLEEPNLSSVQKGLVSDDHLESDHNLTEVIGVERSENACSKSDIHMNNAKDASFEPHLNHDTVICMPTVENGYVSGRMEVNEPKPQGDLPSNGLTVEYVPADGTAGLCGNSDKLEDAINVTECNNEPSVPSVAQINGSCELPLEVRLQKTETEIANNMEESQLHDKAVASNAASQLKLSDGTEHVVEAQSCRGLQFPENWNNHVNDEPMTSNCIGLLRDCNSSLTQPDESSHGVDNMVPRPALQSEDALPCYLETSGREKAFNAFGTSTNVQGEECDVNGGLQSMENQMVEPTLPAENLAYGMQFEQLDNAASNNDQPANLHTSLTSDLPAPEKLLSVPQLLLDSPHDLLVDSTPDKEAPEGGEGSTSSTKLSGKKRTFTESASTVQSLNSVETFGLTKSKRTTESIPDDDDLLSSILVGRRSSVLKIKSTPPAPEVASMKRSRSTNRPSVLKRKVLMDDSMVLLGDTIRQQLTSTEDIRRLRKKAPCTRTEVLMIQRQFLEEEIFGKPVLTGMSSELVCLHSEAFDLTGIRISKNDDNDASLEAKDKKCSHGLFMAQDHEDEGNIEPAICKNHADGEGTKSLVQTENNLVEEHHLGSLDVGKQGHKNDIANVEDPRTSEHELFGAISEMEVDRGNTEIADAAMHSSAQGFETFETEPGSVDISNVPVGRSDQSGLIDDIVVADYSTQMDTSSLPSDKADTQLIGEGAFIGDLAKDIGLNGVEALDHYGDHIVSVRMELMTAEEIRFEERKFGESLKIRDDAQADVCAPTDDIDASLAKVYSETGECINPAPVNVDQTPEDIENDKLGVGNEDRSGAVSLGHGDKDQTSNHLCSEERKMNSNFSLGLEGDFKSASMNGMVFPGCQEADQKRALDTEITSPEHVARDSGDFEDAEFANDTEFLNVDDDEVGEEDDDGMPGAEDTRLLENSGWSSRTRAVAKYLQTLFDTGAGQGRKVLLVDNLLAGKTRKEASRMFFETLVLKTRDYIHVEQLKPFDNINVRPRAKLMKSDF